MRSVVCLVWAVVLVQGADEYMERKLGKHRYQELVTPIVASPNDNRRYAGLVLENDMKVLLISDPTATEAAAALDIPVGFKDDPMDMQGLAHFCEHLLFMGTEKYPHVEDFISYTLNNGGIFSGFTYFTKTNYAFTVQPAALDGALDRFAQFFIAPSFNETVVEREVEAVESELSRVIESDDFRAGEIMKLLSNQSHTFAFNNIGNKETLYTGPISRGIDPRQAVMRFYNDHYSANLMSLVVFGNASLDNLKELTIPKFAAVANKNNTADYGRDLPFSKNQLGIRVGVDSLIDDQTLIMQFQLPSDTSHYRKAPKSSSRESWTPRDRVLSKHCF